MDAQDMYGMDAFEADIGAEAIRKMLSNIDLESTAEQLREDLKEATRRAEAEKIIKRLKIVEVLPQIRQPSGMDDHDGDPCDPARAAPAGAARWWRRFATSDLNDLYRRVINRNNRLKRLIELRAPDIIVRNENGCCKNPSTPCSTTAVVAASSRCEQTPAEVALRHAQG